MSGTWHDKRMRGPLAERASMGMVSSWSPLGAVAVGGFLVEHPGDWRGALYPGVTGLVLFTLMWGFFGPMAFGQRERGSSTVPTIKTDPGPPQQ